MANSWLTAHFKDFVSAGLGRDVAPKLPSGYKRFFVPQEMSVIKNMWRAVKHESVTEGKPLLLAGRDVWIFEVLARRENFPTTFRPDISRQTVRHVKEDYSGYYLFDTGFMGSIPNGLNIERFKMASHSINVSKKLLTRDDSKQVFPRLSGSRSLALKIERTPKYWKSGFYREDKGIGQEFSQRAIISSYDTSLYPEFLRAAYLTIEVYTDSSPKFSEVALPKRSRFSFWDDF